MKSLESIAVSRKYTAPLIVGGLVFVCALPLLLKTVGMSFGSADLVGTVGIPQSLPTDALFQRLSGAFIHTLLEWSAFLIAIFTVVLALSSFSLRRDVTTPIIAVALFFAGCMDAFHTLAADRLITAIADNRNLIPFTWAICRLFNAMILLAGAALVLWGRRRNITRSAGFIFGVSLVFGLAAYAIISYCALSRHLPQTMYPDALMTRPFDVAPLVLFILAGAFVLPRLHAQAQSVFSQAVLLSMIPQIATQLYMAYGSSALFDSSFNIAHFLKIVAYLVPLIGMISHYVETVRNERSQSEQLKAESERHKADLALLHRSEAKLKAVFAALPDIILRMDADGRLIEFQAGEGNALRPWLENHSKENFVDALPTDLAGDFMQGISLALESGEMQKFEYRHTAQGKTHDVEVRLVHSGEEVLAVVRDISDIRRTEERFQLAVSGSSHGIWDWNILTNEVYLAPRFKELLGYADDEFEDSFEAFENAVHPDDRDRVLRALDEHIHYRVQYAVEHRLQTKAGGYRWFLSRGQALWAENGEPVRMAGSISDITDRKNAEVELEESNRFLEQALADTRDLAVAAEIANESKSEFLANMSHEIRTPMNGVVGMASLLLETDLTPEQRDYAETIGRSSDALLTIINDILDFSKIEAGKLTIEPIPFDLEFALREVASLLMARVEKKGIELLVRYAPGCPTRVIADPGRLRQIITNLLGNAIKFTTEGHVLLSVECLSRDGLEAELQVAVEDTGIGIPADKIEHIFQKFTQADSSTTRKFGGTGLGLAIARQLVELMGGEITVQSEPGKGSVFSFLLRLPIDKQAESPSFSDKSLSGLRVAVVGGNEVSSRILMEMARSWGLRCDTFSVPEEALACLRSATLQEDPYEIVVLDARLPGPDGWRLGGEIKSSEELADTELLLLTSSTSKGDVAKLRELGFSAYLTKPLNRDHLLKTFSALVAMKKEGAPRRFITRYVLAESAAQAQHRSTAAERPSREIHVLLADDNEVNQKVAGKMLQKIGCRVDFAESGQEAVAMHQTATYDMILMDCQMPLMDGYEAAETIRRQEAGSSRVPIIAMTANAMKGDRDRCLAAGMDDYIPKPVNLKTLESTVLKWFNRTSDAARKAAAHSGSEVTVVTTAEVAPSEPARHS